LEIKKLEMVKPTCHYTPKSADFGEDGEQTSGEGALEPELRLQGSMTRPHHG